MYKVIIKCNGVVDEIMETRKMSSGEVYKTALSAIKSGAHMEKLSSYDRFVCYDAYVYKNGKLVYLLELITRFIDSEWIGITRTSDMKLCVILGII